MPSLFLLYFLNFLSYRYYNILVAQKVGDNLSLRTGRPRSEDIELKARFDAETDRRIQEYCKKQNKTRTKVVRKGVDLVLANVCCR